MQKRYVSLYFPHLCADWLVIRKPELSAVPFVFARPDHGRMVITAVNGLAGAQQIRPGMRVADAKAMVHGLESFDDRPERPEKLLRGIGEWLIRYSPLVSLDLPDGLILDVSGCTHLWGGELTYLKELVSRLNEKGYTARAVMADTVGAAWAACRYAKKRGIVPAGGHGAVLAELPPEALRLEEAVTERLKKLGFHKIKSFQDMPSSVLRRRFGTGLLERLGQAKGTLSEYLVPLKLPEVFEERLPCLEPICTAKGIEIAITKLLEILCAHLQQEGKGLRTGVLKGYRVDGRVEQIEIGTSTATHSVSHLFKLFELKISSITPALGIELFVLSAPQVDDLLQKQEVFWAGQPGLDDRSVTDFVDRVTGKVGSSAVHRYLPQPRYWPERAAKQALTLRDQPAISWRAAKSRPTQLLGRPERIEVTAPIPDYPPMLFRYQGKAYQVKKADGPERIEREWWIEPGEHRDYYRLEDEQGQRYWVYRSGHYDAGRSGQWYLHGFFA